MNDLADAVVETAGQPCTIRVGIVLSAPPLGTLMIDLGGTVLNPDTVGVASSYHPVVGDYVILMGQAAEGADTSGSTWFVAGKTLPSLAAGASIPYTPSWTTTGLPASYGNGVLLAEWTPVAYRRIDVDFYFQFGATSNPGTGRFFFGTPFVGALGGAGATGACYIFDSGTANRAAICCLVSSRDAVFLTMTPSGDVGQGTPQNFVAGDEIRWSLRMRI